MFKDKSWERVKPLDLGTSVNTLFLVLVAMLGCGVCVFVGENFKEKDRRTVVKVRVELFMAKIVYMLATIRWVLFQT